MNVPHNRHRCQGSTQQPDNAASSGLAAETFQPDSINSVTPSMQHNIS